MISIVEIKQLKIELVIKLHALLNLQMISIVKIKQLQIELVVFQKHNFAYTTSKYYTYFSL